MTNARYQAEILTKDGWRVVGRSKTEQGAEKQAKRAMKAVPSATEYRVIDRNKTNEGNEMKKYQKRSELQEKTAMGYKTLIDEFDMDNVNDALSKVPGMEFAMHLGSKTPRPIRGGGYSSLKIEDINESVAQITEGMDGLFEQKQMQQSTKKKLNESLRDTNQAFNSAFEQVADDLKDSNLVKNPQVYGENLGRMAAFSVFKNFEDTNDPGWESAKDFLKGFASGVLRAAK